MKTFFVFVATCLVVLGTTVMASATTCDPAATTMTPACERQQIAARLPEVTGKSPLVTTGVACLTVWATKPAPLVLAEGRVAAGAPVDGRVLTSWRTQSSMWVPHPQGGYTREICIPTGLLRGTVTLCNEENRSIWNPNQVAYLKRNKRVPASDPACLLGKAACAAFGL